MHVVDIAGVAFLEADEADRDLVGQGYVDIALDDMAEIAAGGVELDVIGGAEGRRIWLIGDDADRARLRACAEQRALRTSERLDALDVVEVNIELPQDGRGWLLVEIDADQRLRGRM